MVEIDAKGLLEAVNEYDKKMKELTEMFYGKALEAINGD